MMLKKSAQISILLVLGFSAGFFAKAEGIVPDPLSLNASPSSPSPGGNVTITAATPTFDKDAAVFNWTVDGKSRSDLSGQGKNIITLTAGEVGSTLRVSVDVLRENGDVLSKSTTLLASDLALTWFAETYVPKWYYGKALPSQSSVVDIVAVPQIIISGRTVDPATLIYNWDFDDEDGALVGAGEEVFRIQTSVMPGTSHHIHLTVEDVNKIVHKESNLYLLATSPRAVIYSSTPLGGIEFRSASAVLSASKTGLLDFVAEPFFFPAASKKQLSYRWNVAGTDVAGAAQNPYVLTLDTSGQAATSFPISVTVQSANDIIPAALKTAILLLP